MKTGDNYRYLNSRIYLNICAYLVFHKDRNLVRKEVEKNLGMLRSYSTEENSGNRSRQLLREVRTQHKDSFFKFWRSSWLDDRLLIITCCAIVIQIKFSFFFYLNTI